MSAVADSTNTPITDVESAVADPAGCDRIDTPASFVVPDPTSNSAPDPAGAADPAGGAADPAGGAADPAGGAADPAAVDAVGGEGAARSVVDEVLAAVEVMGTVDLDRCDHDRLDRLANAASRVRGFVAAFDTRVARRRQQLWAGPDPLGTDPGNPDHDSSDTGDDAGNTGTGEGAGEPDPTLEFAGPAGSHAGGNRPDVDRERDHARARTLVLFPGFEQALAAGEIDGAHIDALTAALARFNTDDPAESEARGEFIAHHEMLLGYARVENPKRFRDRCQQLSLRLARAAGLKLVERQRRDAQVRTWIDNRTGMGHLRATLEPELYEAVVTALDNQLAAIRSNPTLAGEPFERLKVEALAALICHSGALNLHHPEISVLIDLDTLRTGVLDEHSVCETVDGTPLHPDTVRRMACDGHIIPTIMGGEGQPLNVGRRHRKATWAQRRALSTMYSTCGHPGCTVPFRRCRIHHIIWWTNDGLTDLDNLLPLCDKHHHQVHEGGWTLTMTPNRTITLLTPDGTHYYTGTTTNRTTTTNTSTSTSNGTSTSTSNGTRAGTRTSNGARAGRSTPSGSGMPSSSTITAPAADTRRRSRTDTDPASINGSRSRAEPVGRRRRRRSDRPERPERASPAPRAASSAPRRDPAAAHRPIGHRPSLFDHTEGDPDHDDPRDHGDEESP